MSTEPEQPEEEDAPPVEIVQAPEPRRTRSLSLDADPTRKKTVDQVAKAGRTVFDLLGGKKSPIERLFGFGGSDDDDD